MTKVIVTGGAGFIGSALIRMLIKDVGVQVVNVDALTYASNLDSLTSVSNDDAYSFVQGNVCDEQSMSELFDAEQPDVIMHLAAESHVDRSISNPKEFIMTNIVGTLNLLNAAKDCWKDNMEGKIFYHISTDEVYGSLGADGYFYEDTPYDPRSPYSASKASSDHIVRAYNHTYGMPVKISNCSNNYGSHQFPEKLLPLMINNIKHSKPLPVYGEGVNVRDWLWVADHARAIDAVFHKGRVGETYNIGGYNEWKNIDIVHLLCDTMDEKLGREKGTSRGLITFVKDRAGHDMRYAIDATKIKEELGWEPSVTFEQGMDKTIDWYLANEEWMENITSGAYMDYYKDQYTNR